MEIHEAQEALLEFKWVEYFNQVRTLFFFFLGLCPESASILKDLFEPKLFYYSFYVLVKTVIYNRATECGRWGYCPEELTAHLEKQHTNTEKGLLGAQNE